MQPERPKLPTEAIELYNNYIHGEISRRDFMDGVKRTENTDQTLETVTSVSLFQVP
jgi:hypothetical protein